MLMAISKALTASTDQKMTNKLTECDIEIKQQLKKNNGQVICKKNGRRVTKVYLSSGDIPSLNISQLDSLKLPQCCKNKTLMLNFWSEFQEI